MPWRYPKWGILALLVVLVITPFTTSKIFVVGKIVAAPPRAIWDIVTDTNSYPERNPAFIEVSGTYAEGREVRNRVKDPTSNILEMTALVETLRPNTELRRPGGMHGIVHDENKQLLIAFLHDWRLTARTPILARVPPAKLPDESPQNSMISTCCPQARPYLSKLFTI